MAHADSSRVVFGRNSQVLPVMRGNLTRLVLQSVSNLAPRCLEGHQGTALGSRSNSLEEERH